jgi:serine protease Do
MEKLANELMTKLQPAIVNVQVGGAQGTGVVVSPDGYVLTAAHVIGRPKLDASVVFPDGRVVKAKTLGLNRGVDSGMLKIDEPGTWPYADLGESQPLKLGQWLLALGHPGGMDEKRGLVLRVGRVLYLNPTVLRTDCVLVGGDSGGPLFDFHGRVVGIHSRIGSQLWDNFHVPIDVFSEEWDQLVDSKQVGVEPQAYVGITLEEGDSNKVARVPKDGPGDKAGVQAGDVIIKMNDSEIKNRSDFAAEFAKLTVGQIIKIVVLRGEVELNLDLVVGEQ